MRTRHLAAATTLIAGMVFSMGNDTAMAGVHLEVPYMAQPDDQTCLPTSFMMALAYHGRIDDFTSDTVQKLHKVCQYNRFNTPPLAREFDMYALPSWNSLGWTSATVKQELDAGRPVVLGLNTGRWGHFVLAIGYTDDDHFIIHNPSSVAWSPTLGGPDRKVKWDDLLFRGGIMLWDKPFPEGPPLGGVAIEDELPIEAPLTYRMTAGEDQEVSFTLLNNGRVAWPKEMYLAPVDADSTPTRAVKSPLEHPDWISSERVVAALPNLEPGTTGVVTFKVRAPEVDKATTFLQFYQLVDGEGNWFGTHWLASPSNRNMAVRMISYPQKEWQYPLVESNDAEGITLPWAARYGQVEVADDFTTAPPEGGKISRLLTPGQITDIAWIGDHKKADYRIEAWVYCDLRPKTSRKQGYERVGIFARDNGTHMGDHKTEREIGFSLAMTFDSDDGSLRAGDVYNGVIGDYRDRRHKLQESGWHHFAINCKGNTVTYELDGKPFHTQQRVRAHTSGDCGVYYRVPPHPLSPEEVEPTGVVFSGLKVSEL